MTVSTIATRKTVKTVAAKAFAFKGRNASVRTAALAGVASLAYAEGQSRSEMIQQLAIALGKTPTADEIKAVAQQYVVGRTAQKLAASSECKGKSVADLLAFALSLVTEYAAPVKDGTTARKLRAGQKGRRTVAQHKMIRAAEEAWSQVKAEAVPSASNAKTQQQRNAEKPRGAQLKAGKAGTGITHSELVKADGPMTADAAVGYLNGRAATMLAFSNKHAGVVPADYGTAVKAFKRAADLASIAYAGKAK